MDFEWLESFKHIVVSEDIIWFFRELMDELDEQLSVFVTPYLRFSARGETADDFVFSLEVTWTELASDDLVRFFSRSSRYYRPERHAQGLNETLALVVDRETNELLMKASPPDPWFLHVRGNGELRLRNQTANRVFPVEVSR